MNICVSLYHITLSTCSNKKKNPCFSHFSKISNHFTLSLCKPQKELYLIIWLVTLNAKSVAYAMMDILQSVLLCFSYDLLRIKGQAASKYGLTSQPRLVDIIAAVPPAYKKVSS